MKIIFALLFIFSVFSLNAGNYELDDLLDMSLEDLLQIEINSGTLTMISNWETPVALTIIEREDIETCPARNILDVLEVYVPGFTWVQHFMGPRMGLRGMLGDQNYSFLLLINGKNTNLKQYHGPFFDLFNRTLNDIKKIEIIRGPGSVTYGPGAIAGIINIITMSSSKRNYFRGSYQKNYLYRYDNLSFNSLYKNELFTTQIDLQYSSSLGESDTKFWYTDRAHGYGYGFMGEDWGNHGLGTAAPNYLADFNDNPELKFQFMTKTNTGIGLWLRYNNYNEGYITQSRDLFNKDTWQGIEGQQLVTELQYDREITDITDLKIRLGFDSASLRELHYWQGDEYPLDDPVQLGYSYSENEVNVNILANLRLSSTVSLAQGFEYSYEYYAPEWGYDEDTFLMSFQAPINFVVKDTLSKFYQKYEPMGIVTHIDENIDNYSYSLFSEANIDLHEKLHMLISGRLDKNQFAKLAFSPRLAMISPLDDNNILKLIVQKSVRLPVFSNLFSQDYLGEEYSDYEQLKGIEFVYQRMINDKTFLAFNGYYNSTDQYTWLPVGSDSGNTGLAGNFETAGFEIEARYKNKSTHIGLSYAFIEQLDWDPTFNNIGYITIPEQDSILLENYADLRINNLPKHMIKSYIKKNIYKNLSLSFNSRVYIDFQQKEMLDIFQEAIEMSGNQEYIDEMYTLRKALEDNGYSMPSFTSNISLQWFKEFDNFKVRAEILAQNIIQYDHIRYIIQYWEPGNLRQYPRQCGFIEEPASLAFKLSLEF